MDGFVHVARCVELVFHFGIFRRRQFCGGEDEAACQLVMELSCDLQTGAREIVKYFAASQVQFYNPAWSSSKWAGSAAMWESA